MPFSADFDDVYKIAIKEAAQNVSIHAERLDEQMFDEGMLERIYRQIEVADIIIADLSTKNANVFYELGFAHAREKLCILLTSDTSEIPFDLRHRRHIVYGTSLTFLRDELTKNLEWAKTEIQNVRESQIRVEFKPSGDLDVDNTSASATVSFKFDLFNDSKKPSPTINAIYFYTGYDWQFSQDDKLCPKTAADVQPFSHMYFMKPPVVMLQPSSWAQVELKGTRLIAAKWRGDEIKESYSMNGRGLLRFVTSTGTYDHEISVALSLDSIPF
jgi:nucleoside 2-deoxyribosyltransferase